MKYSQTNKERGVVMILILVFLTKIGRAHV